MKVLLVYHDLKNKNKSYSNFFKELKKVKAWWHYLESCWLLKTQLLPKQLFDKLIPYVDEGDALFIIEVTPNYYGFLSGKAWPWIEKNLG